MKMNITIHEDDPAEEMKETESRILQDTFEGVAEVAKEIRTALISKLRPRIIVVASSSPLKPDVVHDRDLRQGDDSEETVV